MGDAPSSSQQSRLISKRFKSSRVPQNPVVSETEIVSKENEPTSTTDIQQILGSNSTQTSPLTSKIELPVQESNNYDELGLSEIKSLIEKVRERISVMRTDIATLQSQSVNAKQVGHISHRVL